MNFGSFMDFSGFTVKAEDGDVYVYFRGDGDSSTSLCLSREEALELSCRLEQAAQKIKESEDSRKGG